MRLTRAAIDATAKDKQITEGTVCEIEALATQGLIRQVVKEAAHEVRPIGDDMAHGDFRFEPRSDSDTRVGVAARGADPNRTPNVTTS